MQRRERVERDHKVASLAPQQQQLFFDFIRALLSGQNVSKESIAATGLDPDFVFSKARGVLRGHNFASVEIRRGNPRSKWDTLVSPTKEKD